MRNVAKLIPVCSLCIMVVVVATSCATTARDYQTITKDISGFPIKEGQILMEHGRGGDENNRLVLMDE